ncbi:unnamed protein product [Cylicocyclus nassatus]|uniref:Uncharacterized protein n=1 Tax=Cylicocyclus nassatus TaxID=53992 RepID=A0AA36DSD7_CYLNA|nr:unnamed protein product [Cylicocyclus nassatus]
MRSTSLLVLSFAALALANSYNPHATSNKDPAQNRNFFRHNHRRTHRPLLTTEQSITASAKVDKATGNIEVVTPAAGFHRTPKNRITRGLPEQSSNIPLLVHGAGVTDNSKAHITQKDLDKHHRRRTAHPLPTGKTSTSADAGKVTGNADGVTPAAKKAAILLTGWVGRLTRRPSTAKPEARAHRTHAAVTGLAPVITAKSGLHATDDSAWLKRHVTIAA